jgi:hypothetical protein
MMSPQSAAASPQVSSHLRAEELLGALRGVTAVSIDGLDDRRVTELRVVSTDEMSRRQVERNLASALMAGFGIELEHGAIRFVDAIERSAVQVAQSVQAGPTVVEATSSAVSITAGPAAHSRAKFWSGNPRLEKKRAPSAGPSEVTRIDARARAAEAEAPETDVPVVQPKFALTSVRLTELADGRFRYSVTLDARGVRCVGEVEGAGSELSRIECAARAVVEASRSVLNGRLWYLLDGVRLVELMGRSYVLSAVRTSDDDARVTSAASAIETTIEHASAAATVAALNS